METDLIELVAESIHRSLTDGDSRPLTWDEAHDGTKAHYREAAVAALKAQGAWWNRKYAVTMRPPPSCPPDLWTAFVTDGRVGPYSKGEDGVWNHFATENVPSG